MVLIDVIPDVDRGRSDSRCRQREREPVPILVTKVVVRRERVINQGRIRVVARPAGCVAAYDDPLGVTAAFNKNLLLHLNADLGATFDIDGFGIAPYGTPRPRASRCIW